MWAFSIHSKQAIIKKKKFCLTYKNDKSIIKGIKVNRKIRDSKT